MAEEKLDYTAQFINHIKAKIAALQAVLASVESASALGALGQPLEGMSLSPVGVARGDSLGMPTDLPEGAFNGKSIPVCVELYLSAAKKKKTNKEIAAALRDGGVESKAGNFENVVTGALFGLKKAGKVLRFKEGWGLAEWYPPHIRGTAPDATKRPRKKGKKARVKEKASGPAPVATATNVAEMPTDKPEPRIINFFKSNPREASASDVAKALGLKIQTTNLILAKLAHQKKIEKLPGGRFKAVGVVAAG